MTFLPPVRVGFVRAFLAVTALGALSACAPQARVALPQTGGAPQAVSTADFVKGLEAEQRVEDRRRLDRVAFKVLSAAAELCDGQLRPYYGLTAVNADGFDSELRQAARAALGLGARPAMLYVVPDSPAARAGLRAGDVITTIDGRPVASGAIAAGDLERLAASTSRPVTVGFERGGDLGAMPGGAVPGGAVPGGEVHGGEVTVTPVPVCDIPLRLAPGEAVNAWSVGRSVRFSGGMVRFAHEDAELALVMAHEVAHIVLEHNGSVLSYLSYTADPGHYEAEADYVGLYLVARAGYDPHAGLGLLRRMALSFPHLNDTQTHLATRARFDYLQRALDEMEAKRHNGEPLLPNRIAKG